MKQTEIKPLSERDYSTRLGYVNLLVDIARAVDVPTHEILKRIYMGDPPTILRDMEELHPELDRAGIGSRRLGRNDIRPGPKWTLHRDRQPCRPDAVSKR